jgi:zinc transporter ZupT
MLEDYFLVGGVLIKYGMILFFIGLVIAVLHSFLTKLRNEPRTLAKLLLVTLTPPALALSVPYFIMHQRLGTPFLLNVVAGFVIYAVTQGFLEKHISVRFRDEDASS